MKFSGRLGVNVIVCLAMMASAVSCSSSSMNQAGDVGSKTAATADPTADSTDTGAAGKNGQSGEQDGGGSDATAEKGGTIRYTGAQAGELEFTSVGCATLNGDFLSLIAPDLQVASTARSRLGLNNANGKWLATVTPDTSDMAHSYVGQDMEGVAAAEHDGIWVVTLSDAKLGGAAASEVTVNGTLTCTRVVGS